MRCVELSQLGIENLTISEREQPSAGPGEVVVQVRAAAVNYRDFMIAMGFYNPELALPLIPLSDGAGDVIEVGDGVNNVKPGDRVTSLFWQSWADGAPTPESISTSTGCDASGMLTEFAVLPEASVTGFPDNLSYEEAATLPCAGVTAWRAVKTLGGVGPGDSVLLLGTGGVSLFGLQFAKALGAKVIITSSSDEKLKRARELGADYGINYEKNPEWGKEAFEQAGLGVKVVVETGGAGTLQQSIAALGWDGHIAYLGGLAGMSAELNLLGLVAKNAHLHGLTVGSRTEHEKMVGFVDEHGIKPVIGERFDFHDGPQAIAVIAAGQHFGKIVINIG